MAEQSVAQLREALAALLRPGRGAAAVPTVTPGADLPEVAQAPLFRRATEVMGPPELQRAVEALFKVQPELRGRVKRVQAAPTSTMQEKALRQGYPVHYLSGANILGAVPVAGLDEMYISPGFFSRGMVPGNVYGAEHPVGETVAHEFGHVMGQGHGPQIDEIERLARELAVRGGR